MTPVLLVLRVYDGAMRDRGTAWRRRLPDDLPVIPAVGDVVPITWLRGHLTPITQRAFLPGLVECQLGAWVVDPAPDWRQVTDRGGIVRAWRTENRGDLVERLTADGWSPDPS